jgi:hypothetical protein
VLLISIDGRNDQNNNVNYAVSDGKLFAQFKQMISKYTNKNNTEGTE